MLVEAGIAMIVASIAIRLLPFRTLAAAMSRSAGACSGDPAGVGPMTRAIRAWSRRLPWRTMCFEEGMAAHWMLRRRKITSTLYYGAATIDGELKAHVWVRSGELDVIGCGNAADYAVLARFPAETM